MRERARVRARWLAALLGACLLAVCLMPVRALAAEPNSLDEVYVSASGDDKNSGSRENPFATLATAVDTVKDGGTVYVVSDLITTSCARYYGKHITITSGEGGPYTIKRGADRFDALSDPARSRYNPAMIEVGSIDGPETASLTLTNIVLDDDGQHVGKYYIQAASNGTGTTEFGDMQINHLDIVQDAIIATYNNVGTITLGDGAVLKNFGGMSAVRLASGKLVMESGSKIVDDSVTSRTKGEKITGANTSYYGPAGAVWLQGGSIEMEQGSQISGIVGRAIYADPGEVTINGSINNVCGDSDMWWGTGGTVMHLRSDATATLGSTGVIDGQDRKTSGSSVAVLGGCEFTADEGSLIKDIAGGNIIDVGGTAHLNGEITGCSGGGHVILAQSSSNHYVRVGETANIHHNVSAYGVIYTQGSNGVIDIYGKLNDNVSTDRGGALVLANNGSHVEANMYDGAEMCRNVSYQTGGAVMVSCGTFTMEGGTISGNISGAGNVGAEDKVAGAVYVRRGGQFIMNSGTISDNSAAGIGGNIALQASDYNGSVPYVQLNGGSITGGTMNVDVTESNGTYTAAGGEANDLTIVGGTEFGKTDRYLSVGNDVVLSEQSIYMDDYGFYLENPAHDVKLGNASSNAENAAKTAYANQSLTTVVGSFWYETPSGTQPFSVSGLTYDTTKPLYAALVATDESGAPIQDAAVPLYAVTPAADGSFLLNVPGQNTTGYAFVFLQETPEEPAAKVVTVTPVNLTVYEGGEGYSAVVDGNGATTENSLPHPMFRIEGVDNPTGLTFTNETAGKSWTVVSVGDGYYHFAPAVGQDDVRVTYTNAAGEVVTSDQFDVSAVSETFAQYAVNLYLGENSLAELSAQQGDDTYAVALGSGTLTVRAVEADDPSDVTTDIATTAPGPSDKLQAGTALAVEPEGGTSYTLNDTGVALPSDARPQLLFDDIITSDGVDRESALRTRVDEELGGADSARQYQMKYLDLVDGANSNAWITSENGVDIYWAYPEGTDESTDFSLLHFKDLHRDGTQSGFDAADVADAEVEDVTIEKTAQGIRFHVAAGGFSPYVLTWGKTTSGGGTVTPTRYTITATAGQGGSISPSGTVTVSVGADRTFTITPDEGNKVADVVIDGTSVGALGSYTFEDVRANHTISVTFARGNAPADPSDTGVDQWFDVANHNAFMRGYDDGTGTFGPNDNMSRAHAAQMFYNMLKDKSRGDIEVTFPDVDPDAWYAEAVGVLASRGIIRGDDLTGTFRPSDPVSRAEFTAMAMRFSKGDYTGENIFTDVHEGDWFYGVVVGSVKYGWINGYQDGSGRFGPADTLTRADAATIANRMLGRVPDGVWIANHKDELKLFPDVPESHYAWRDIVEATNSHDYEKNGGFETWTGLK